VPFWSVEFAVEFCGTKSFCIVELELIYSVLFVAFSSVFVVLNVALIVSVKF
jgi:hypothetical protein